MPPRRRRHRERPRTLPRHARHPLTAADHEARLDGWASLQRAAAGVGPLSSCEVDLTALLGDEPSRRTIEGRILPATLHACEVVRRATLVEGLLVRCLDPHPYPRQVSADVQASAAALG